MCTFSARPKKGAVTVRTLQLSWNVGACILSMHVYFQCQAEEGSSDRTYTTTIVECRRVYFEHACVLSVPGKGKSRPTDMEAMKPLLQLVFYCIEKVSRFQLSKEVSPFFTYTRGSNPVRSIRKTGAIK